MISGARYNAESNSSNSFNNYYKLISSSITEGKQKLVATMLGNIMSVYDRDGMEN